MNRSRNIRRILEVQRHLHEMAELKYLNVKRRIDACGAEEQDLADALSGENALQGLFVDVTVKRINSLRQEAQSLQPALRECARSLLEHGARIKSAERLLEDLNMDERRAAERRELEAILEVSLPGASLKQDR